MLATLSFQQGYNFWDNSMSPEVHPAQRGRPRREKAIFRLLGLIMTETPLSTDRLRAASDISVASIGRARRGEPLLRSTQAALFEAIVKNDRCRFLLPLRGRLLVPATIPLADSDLEQTLLDGFNNTKRESNA
jgi:hypothetical protein